MTETLTLLVAMDEALLRITSTGGSWKVDTKFQGKFPQAIACDPSNPTVVYCGTFGEGLWRSNDAGETWNRGGAGSLKPEVISVSISRSELAGKLGVVYAGTEPSAIFRSRDGGETWEEMRELTRLPSSNSWSFPPRPQTHHVRWISTDPSAAWHLYVCIEAGALVRSFDGGETWKDRVRGGPYDTHTLGVHPQAPGRLYSSAGDGYFESDNGGDSWKRIEQGLRHRYLYGLAIDSRDQDLILVSASSSPFSAHHSTDAESFIYRKENGQNEWNEVTRGLDDPSGTIISSLAASPSNKGEFFAANNRGVYQSQDSGITWKRLEIPWSKSYLVQHAWSICVLQD